MYFISCIYSVEIVFEVNFNLATNGKKDCFDARYILIQISILCLILVLSV